MRRDLVVDEKWDISQIRIAGFKDGWKIKSNKDNITIAEVPKELNKSIYFSNYFYNKEKSRRIRLTKIIASVPNMLKMLNRLLDPTIDYERLQRQAQDLLSSLGELNRRQ